MLEAIEHAPPWLWIVFAILLAAYVIVAKLQNIHDEIAALPENIEFARMKVQHPFLSDEEICEMQTNEVAAK